MKSRDLPQTLLIGVVLFGLALTGCSPEVEPINPPLYSFFVAGHTYGNPAVNNVGLHPPFQDKYDLIRNDPFMDFGVLTGDIVFLGFEEDWDEVDRDVALIERPVYFAPGNHDITDRPLFEARYGSPYKSFIENDDLFIILDPNLDAWNISGDQLQFLQRTLDRDAPNVENIFVFFHQVLWWTPNNIYKNITLNSDQGRAENINFWSEVEPLFSSLANPVVMFAGDVGANPTGSEFMYHNYDNITLIASGMGGEQRDNFIVADVLEDKTIYYRLIALNGSDEDALGKLEDYVLP